VDTTPQRPRRRELEETIQQMALDRAKLDAVVARVDALELEMPLGQVELQEEIDRLDAQLQAVLTRLVKLEADGPASNRSRGVIGALRVERPGGDADAGSD
jgi:uncharacterized coiled-coil protein SlyX